MHHGEMSMLISRADGFQLDAYRVGPRDARRGGLVLAQEIFGVTDHIKELADSFAEDGYEVIAPALFDRQEKGFQADYSSDGIQKGLAYAGKTNWDQVVGDMQAAIDALAQPVFVTGFCYGGAVAWLTAARCTGVRAASGFYGRLINQFLDEAPKVPTILHYGRNDHGIPMERVEEVRARHPDIPVYIYDAGHGFMSDRRDDFDPDSARLARLRTLQLFHQNGAGGGKEAGA